MPAWPDAPALRDFLARARRRLSLLAAARGAAIGIALAAIGVAAAWAAGVVGQLAVGFLVSLTVLLAAAAAALGWWRGHRAATRVPALVEARAPECRHLLVTAAELLKDPARVSPYIGAVVCRDAARVVSRLDVAALFPARRAAAVVSGGVVFWIGMALGIRALPPPRLTTTSAMSANAAIAIVSSVDITVTPPAYTGQPASTLHDPVRLTVLAGSTIHVDVRAVAATVDLDTIAGRTALEHAGDRFTGDVVADADGFIALQPGTSSGLAGARRFMGLVVEPDRAPLVRVVKPGRDLFVADAKPTFDLGIEASDDIGLSSLTLVYTKVTGSGENFEFKRGEAPVQMARKNDREWIATTTWNLASMKLEPGDMVVYRALANDARPGRAAVESDAFIVQIVAPGSVAAEGFAADDLKDKYALSQRMVVIKTERLIAKKPTMSAADFTEEAANIAAEQKSVRAEFVFMLGGELGGEGGLADLNEELEAAGEADLAAGRMQNRGRIEVLSAIRRMSDAVASLNVPDTTAALKFEKAALEMLQSAFSRSRYLLRALTQRESLDLTRRLSGLLNDLSRDTRVVPEAAIATRVHSMRTVLARVAALAGHDTFGRDEGVEATAIAEAVLRMDPGSADLQRVAQRLIAAGDAIGASRARDVPGILEDVAISLTDIVRADVQDAPAAAIDPRTSRLSGALADALRASKGRR